MAVDSVPEFRGNSYYAQCDGGFTTWEVSKFWLNWEQTLFWCPGQQTPPSQFTAAIVTLTNERCWNVSVA